MADAALNNPPMPQPQVFAIEWFLMKHKAVEDVTVLGKQSNFTFDLLGPTEELTTHKVAISATTQGPVLHSYSFGKPIFTKIFILSQKYINTNVLFGKLRKYYYSGPGSSGPNQSTR